MTPASLVVGCLFAKIHGVHHGDTMAIFIYRIRYYEALQLFRQATCM